MGNVLSCALFGHRVDNREFSRSPRPVRTCGCGREYLQEGGETRVRHTLSCFFSGHTYVPAGTRDGHNEYVCDRCGHPLLFAVDRDPYAAEGRFEKKVRYLCNLFGHDVYTVATRHGFTEYACGCGHTFLHPQPGLARVTHPPICTVAGHFIRFVERRGGWDEHRCRNCGHTFGFAEAA